MKRILLTLNYGNSKPQTWTVDNETSNSATDQTLFVSRTIKHADKSVSYDSMVLTLQPDGSYKNQGGIPYITVVPDRRPKPYSIDAREEGRGPANITKFATLAEVQAYVKSQWQGAEYIDCLTSFHTDYCRFTLKGCTLDNLGHRAGEPGSDEYYDWVWEAL